MRPHVCIPSGCQQWVSKTVAVGVDKFAYMSSLAIYVHSSQTYLPLAILAKHEKHLSALAMSPYDANLLACAISNHELRLYDVDTELPISSVKYSSPKATVSILEWHRSQPGILLAAVGSHLYAWDVSAACSLHGSGTAATANSTATTNTSNGNTGNGSNNTSSGGGAGYTVAAPPPPQPAPPPQPPPRSMLMRLKGARGGAAADGSPSASSSPSSSAPSAPHVGRWVFLRDLGAVITAIDQCASPAATTATATATTSPAAAAGAASGGAAAASGGATQLAVATAGSRVVLLELQPSGLAVRREVRSITLPDAATGGSGSGSGSATTAPSAISSVSWEPLSGSGLLLVVTRGGTMALYDASSGEVVLQYGKQPATAARFTAFLPSQPGNFLCSSSRSGALQLYNVSQPHPLRMLKLGGGLVQGFTLINPRQQHQQSGAPAAAAATSARRGAASLALVSFGDGSLCVYDLAGQQVVWRQEGGHTETIFDCRFCTTDPDLLATACFDSIVRIWDVRSGRCVRQLAGAEGILYSLSWSADGRLLAACNDVGAVYLYDMARGLLVKALRQHAKQALKVSFHPTKPTLLASASIDGTVVVFSADGDTHRTLRHFAPVAGLAWSCWAGGGGGGGGGGGAPAHQLLATCCDTGQVHVWDLQRPTEDCLVRTLERHASRAFHLEFSPLLPHTLLSSSNDRTARVWDVAAGDCTAVLQGHTAEVRAVAWHPEVAHICFTGSWDATIRVWDVRSGACLHVASDHHADVYGLSCHPRRPFLLASCSRDTTLRLWSTLELTPHLLPQALVRPLSELRAAPQEALQRPPAAPALLSGAGSRELAERLGAAAAGGGGGARGGGGGGCSPLERLAALCEFFLPPACMDVFWDLAHTVRRGGAATTPADDGGGASGGTSGGLLLPSSRQRFS
ncbi:hypothetical protein Agub_g4328, partial [Astrephomene gubernaculifera]